MSRVNNLGLGILLILGSCLLLAASDALCKVLIGFYPVFLVVWLRYVMQTLLMLGLFAPRMGRQLVTTQRPLLQLLRAACLVGTTVFMYSSLLFIPLGEATAVLFLAPMVVVAISAFILKESISLGLWLACALGLAGVFIIVRPSGGLFTPYILLPMLSAVCLGVFQLITRKLSHTDQPVSTNFISALCGTLLLSLGLPWVWRMPKLEDVGIAFIVGLLAVSGHLLLTHSYRFSSASALAPFTYAQIIFAALFGALLFGHVPDHGSMFGMMVIIASGLWVAWSRRATSTAVEPRA